MAQERGANILTAADLKNENQVKIELKREDIEMEEELDERLVKLKVLREDLLAINEKQSLIRLAERMFNFQRLKLKVLPKLQVL